MWKELELWIGNIEIPSSALAKQILGCEWQKAMHSSKPPLGLRGATRSPKARGLCSETISLTWAALDFVKTCANCHGNCLHVINLQLQRAVWSRKACHSDCDNPCPWLRTPPPHPRVCSPCISFPQRVQCVTYSPFAHSKSNGPVWRLGKRRMWGRAGKESGPAEWCK